MAEQVVEKIYNPSQKEVETINRVFGRFKKMQEERDKVRHEFDGLTLTQYVNNSMNGYNGIVSEELKATKDDWQSIIWDHKTRGKVKAVISMIVGMRPFISIVGKNRESNQYAMDLFDVYEDSWKQENGAYKLYLQALSACCKGTVIVEETYEEEKIKQKEIISIDHKTGRIKFNIKEVIKGGIGQVKTKIISLLNFYPNENSAEVEHDCCVVELYQENNFKKKYGKYPNSEFVKTGVFASSQDYDGINYKSISSYKDKLVEVIKYFNEDEDEFVILANGFWINPQDEDEVSPLPFDHKKLPFAKTVFELLDEDCFYGASLPYLTSGEQDADNAILRLMIDQEILAINKPILLGLGIEIDSYQLYPGKVIKMSGPIDQQKEMDISGANQSSFQLLQLLKSNIDTNTALDPIVQGVHQGRKTAREAVILDENAKKSSGPFQLHIYKLLLDRAKLRVENLKQFYTKPLQYSVLKDKYGKPITNEEGKTRKVPEYREITVPEFGKAPRWISVKPEIKGCEFDIRFVEDFEVTDNRSYRIEMATALLDEAKVNPLLNADEATIDYLEALRKNPDRFYIKPTKEAMDFQNNQNIPPENPPQEV